MERIIYILLKRGKMITGCLMQIVAFLLFGFAQTDLPAGFYFLVWCAGMYLVSTVSVSKETTLL